MKTSDRLKLRISSNKTDPCTELILCAQSLTGNHEVTPMIMISKEVGSIKSNVLTLETQLTIIGRKMREGMTLAIAVAKSSSSSAAG